MKGHDMAKKATAGEREADGYYQDSRRDGYQDRTKLARRFNRAIARAVKARDAEWFSAVVEAVGGQTALDLSKAVGTLTTPKPAPGKPRPARSRTRAGFCRSSSL